MSAADVPAERRRCDNAVELNVGGTIFKAAPSTLSTNSTYFRALFSDEWRDEGPIFIDQDPAPFRVLLSFMRKGCIEVDKLDVDAILLAEFLGIERLIAAVKCISYCNLNPDHDGSDDEAVAAFDEERGSIQAAVSTGVLPDALTKKREWRKEYCTLVLWQNHQQHFTPAPGGLPMIFDKGESVASLIYGSQRKEGQDDEPATWKDAYVMDCPTLLDCLNWLSQNGYRSYEKDTKNAIMHRSWMTLTFTKNKHRPLGDLSLAIIDKNRFKDMHVLHKKEFAALFPAIAHVRIIRGYHIKADVGKERQLIIESNDEDYVSGPQRSNITLEAGNSMEEAMGWLQKEGYTEREAELETIYNKMFSHNKDDMLQDSIKLYSRKVKDSISEQPTHGGNVSVGRWRG